MKALNKTSDGFNFLKTEFSHLSQAKIKEGIFVSCQIRVHLNRKEKRAWLEFWNVCVNILGNKTSDDYVIHMEELLSAYKAIQYNETCRLRCISLSHTWTFSLKIRSSFGWIRRTVQLKHHWVRKKIFRELGCEHAGKTLLVNNAKNFYFRVCRESKYQTKIFYYKLHL